MKRARERGVSVDAYLRELIEAELPATEQAIGLSPQEKVDSLREWVASHGLDTPTLSDEAISRERIYGERG